MKKPERSARLTNEAPRGCLFPVVGVAGAQAGAKESVDSFTSLLPHLPTNTGMAFVMIPHATAQSAGKLASSLARSTAMPVAEASRKTVIRPNHVYVIPPGTPMRISDSVLDIAPPAEKNRSPQPIDYFFRSLASDRKALGIGVVLSPADPYGVPGLQAIREQGGIAIVQSGSSTEDNSNRPAVSASGVADLCLTVREIGQALGKMGQLPLLSDDELFRNTPEPLDRILELLSDSGRVDFSAWKRGIIHGKILRRIMLRQRESLDAYLALLESDPSELDLLRGDLLIHATGFFRESDTFAIFAAGIFPRLLKDLPSGHPFRIWVPGCATGEEVYSIAMSLLEAVPASRATMQLQIFGTDISERVIAAARAARYSAADLSRLSPERRNRFFVPVDGGFQIVKAIREMCVFARHDLLSSPPFSGLNLISCRNLLLYLAPDLQRAVIETFHYGLHDGGCLLPGRSESVREFPQLFQRIGKQGEFYRRTGARHPIHQTPSGRSPGLPHASEAAFHANVEKRAEGMVLSEYGPPWVLVNANLDVINSRGDHGPYLQFAAGKATLNVLRMVRGEVRVQLNALLEKARAGEARVRSSFLHEERGEIRRTEIEVRHIPAGSGYGGACYLILFFPAAKTGKTEDSVSDRPASKTERDAIERLRQGLSLANQRLEAMLAERDAATEELVSANEEVQSSNEELQSINEELEASREELQAGNEELNSLNEELRDRNRELGLLSDDLANLLSSTTIPILMVDNNLRIRRVTQAAERLFGIRPLDIGRPIGGIRLRLSETDLDVRIQRVIDSLAGEEIELLDREGRWHILRIRPYRTSDSRIEGAVLTMLDIDQLRRAQSAADLARGFAEAIVEAVQIPLLVLKPDLRVRVANHAFLAAYGLLSADVKDRLLEEISKTEWNLREFKLALLRLSGGKTSTEEFECIQEITGGAKRIILINARSVLQHGSHEYLIAIHDVTAQRRAEQSTAAALHETEDALRLRREELRALTGSLLHAQDEERRRVSRELHDDISQNVLKLQFDIEALEKRLPPAQASEKRSLMAVRDDAVQLSNELRRIAYALHPSTLDNLGLTAALSAYAYEFSRRTGVAAQFSAAGVPGEIRPEIASCFYRIAQEALRNVVRHSGAAASIRLTGENSLLILAIRDGGPGFDRESVRGRGGLGLVSMEERARLVNATFELSTAPGEGVSLTISAPLDDLS